MVSTTVNIAMAGGETGSLYFKIQLMIPHLTDQSDLKVASFVVSS